MSEGDNVEAAVDEASAELDGAADLLVVFATRGYATDGMLARLRSKFPSATIIGSTAGGVVAAGREVEHREGLSLTAATLPGVQLAWTLADAVPAESRGVLTLCDPFTDTDPWLASLDASTDAPVFGGIASGGEERADFRLFRDDDLLPGGELALSFSGNVAIETLVAQGCRPVGEPMLVVRGEKNIIEELDCGNPLNTLRELASTLPPDDEELVRSALFLGIQMRDKPGVYEHGDFLIRTIIGFEPTRGALAVAAALDGHPVVQFHVRDAEASRADLAKHLAAHPDPPAGALMFSCLGRGEALYGAPDHDSEMIRAAWFEDRSKGSQPMGGFFCNGEIGPVGGRTFLHAYTTSLVRFSPRSR